MSGYPWTRRVVRGAFRVLGRRRYAHWEQGWPHLGLRRPEGDGPGAVLWKGRAVAPLLSARAFAERVGEEVVIVGSGPSLRGQRVEAVPAEAAILLNGALTLAPRWGGALAGAVSDETFVWAHHEMMRAHLPQVRLWLLSPPVLRALLSIAPDVFGSMRGEQAVVLLNSLQRPWRGPHWWPEHAKGPHILRNGQAAISTDPDRGVTVGGTVALMAMQVALHARPRLIGLAGIDIAEGPRIYDTAVPQPTQILEKAPRILAHFALAIGEAERRGIRVECYSPISALLPLCPYSDRLERPQ